MKVEATYIDYNTLKCLSPPSNVSGIRHLEVALDDFHFTNYTRGWTYYDPTQLVVSAVDPIGGPVQGGTILEVLGSGFEKLGGTVQHGATTLAHDSPDAYRRVDSGVFCKYSIDAARAPRGQEPWCSQVHKGQRYDNVVETQRDFLPEEGAAAMMRASTHRHVRNASCFSTSSTPSLGRLTSVVQATFVDSSRMLCESPTFAGVLKNNRAILRVHVTLNGDFHQIGSLSESNATYTIYDPRESRIQTMERTGGPIIGGTYIVIYGKLFFDFSLITRPAYAHLPSCRFGDTGSTPATRLSEQQMACYSPHLYGTGHRQAVTVDITFNGQDYVRGFHFTYSPRDQYQVEGLCRDAFGATVKPESLCMNNFTGIAVSELQPFGGPSTGDTRVVVLGRNFEVQGPSILCKFGNLTMVPATFLNETAVTCLAPPNPYVLGTFEDHFVEVTLNGEPNFLTRSQVPYVYYDHNATLVVSSIYPQAGPKTGGNTITVYGTGFRVLGGPLRRPCDSVPLNSTAAEELYGVDRTTGSLSRGQTLAFGDSRVCADPQIDGTNRGLQCLFGDLPAVHAYLIRVNGSDPLRPPVPMDELEDDRVGTALICELPALPPPLQGYSSYVPGQQAGRELLPGAPQSVCVELTLNGNRSQATKNCVEFTYYDM